MFDFFKTTEKLPQGIKKLLKPRKEFTEQTKMTFLAVFDAAHPESVVRHRVGAFAKTAIALGALLAIFASASVYADTTNVAADSPLYPLKRFGESVQLTVAPTSEKAQLQATFAARRASEVVYLQARKSPSSVRIAALSNDLNTALDSSLTDAQSAKLGDGQLANFCSKVLPAISPEAHPNLIRRFAAECGQDLGGSVVVGSNTGASSSTISTNLRTLLRLHGVRL